MRDADVPEQRGAVVVIGAGVAGCAAAIALARNGLCVTAVESRRFPRAKVCGEFISPAATAALEELLPPERLHAAGARRVSELVLERGSSVIGFDLPTPAWVLSRRTLDAALLDVAREAGVHVIQPAAVRSVAYTKEEVTVKVSRSGRELRSLRCALAVHADGSGRFDAASGGADRATPKRSGVIGLKCHLQHDPARFTERTAALRMRAASTRAGMPGVYAGYVPVERGDATVAMVVRSSAIARFSDYEGGITGGGGDALLAKAWPALAGAERLTPWLACPVAGSWYRRPSHPRSMRIGNAAAAVEPVGGEGIGLALRAGLDLARAVKDEIFAGGSLAETSALARVERKLAGIYRHRLVLRRPGCTAAAWVLERPGVSGALWPLIATPKLGPGLVRGWCRATGKSGVSLRLGRA